MGVNEFGSVDVGQWNIVRVAAVALVCGSACSPGTGADGDAGDETQAATDEESGTSSTESNSSTTTTSPDDGEEYSDGEEEGCYYDSECYGIYTCADGSCVPGIPSFPNCSGLDFVPIPVPGGTPVANVLGFANVDDDADDDLIIAATDGVYLLHGPGDQPATQITQKAGTPTAIAIGDLDGDQRPDVVVADEEGEGSIAVLLNDGLGSLSEGTSLSQTGSFVRLWLVDLDQDTNVDLVAQNQDAVVWWQGDGAGGLADQGALVMGVSTPVAVMQVSGEGWLDLARGTANEELVWSELPDGPDHAFEASSPGASRMLGLDVDEDDVADLVTRIGGALRIFRGTGTDLELLREDIVEEHGDFFDMVPGRIAGASVPDLALAGPELFVVIDAGGDACIGRYQAPNFVIGVAAGDFTGDGDQELAISRGYDNGPFLIVLDVD